MPRILRKDLVGKELFHIMVQGINKEKIFKEDKEKLQYIKLMNKYAKDYKIKIIAYCAMDNHIHILIKVEKINNLSNYMHIVNSSYALYYNKRKDRVGYVYRDRYKVQVINDIKHMYRCIIYIHNNPVKAKICKIPEQYKFSSYIKFIEKDSVNIYDEIFLSKDEYKKAHIKNDTIDMDFFEDEEDKEYRKIEIQRTINVYLQDNNINILEIQLNNKLLRPIALKLRETYNLSYRDLEKYLKVNREKIRYIIK